MNINSYFSNTRIQQGTVVGVVIISISLSSLYYLSKSKPKVNCPPSKTLETILSEAKNPPDVADLCGVWEVDNEEYPVLRFECRPCNIVQISDSRDAHALGECGACGGVGSCINSDHDTSVHSREDVLAVIDVPMSCWTFRYPSNMPFYFNFMRPEGYRFVLHRNGVIKFVPAGSCPIHRFSCARADSCGWVDYFKNLLHGALNGCFCLGVLTKDGALVRYNRWSEQYPVYFWAARRVR